MKKGPNPQNYKIVKCKFWEKEGTCRYGTLCTFAHGDTEMRSKTDNYMMIQQPQNFYDPNSQMQNSDFNLMPGVSDPMFSQVPFNMMNPYAMGFDPNMMMGQMMGFPHQNVYDPNMMMNQMNPNLAGNFNNIPSGNFPNQSGNNSKTGTN
jgi:hypothetical protein